MPREGTHRRKDGEAGEEHAAFRHRPHLEVSRERVVSLQTPARSEEGVLVRGLQVESRPVLGTSGVGRRLDAVEMGPNHTLTVRSRAVTVRSRAVGGEMQNLPKPDRPGAALGCGV